MGEHYLRVVRALALGAALVGCGDDDGDAFDAPTQVVADARTDAPVPDAPPSFDAPRDAMPQLIDGPLAPPDLPRAA